MKRDNLEAAVFPAKTPGAKAAAIHRESSEKEYHANLESSPVAQQCPTNRDRQLPPGLAELVGEIVPE